MAKGDRINALLSAAGYNMRKLVVAFYLSVITIWKIMAGTIIKRIN